MLLLLKILTLMRSGHILNVSVSPLPSAYTEDVLPPAELEPGFGCTIAPKLDCMPFENSVYSGGGNQQS